MAERERIGASPDGERHSSGRLEELSDLELVEAMRAADERAFEEFVRRFQLVVLIQARRFRIEASERRQWVTEVLYQAGMALSRRRTPAYGSVVAYLVTVCKRKCLADRRALVARERLEAECTGPLGSDNGEQAVLSLCSEATMRATYGAEWEPEGLPPILARFVSMLGDSMCAGRPAFARVGRTARSLQRDRRMAGSHAQRSGEARHPTESAAAAGDGSGDRVARQR